MKPHREKLSVICTLYGWQVEPTGRQRPDRVDDGEAYILTAREYEGHPLLGDSEVGGGDERYRFGWIEIIDFERGFAITKSGTRYALA